MRSLYISHRCMILYMAPQFLLRILAMPDLNPLKPLLVISHMIKQLLYIIVSLYFLSLSHKTRNREEEMERFREDPDSNHSSNHIGDEHGKCDDEKIIRLRAESGKNRMN